jgi:hypothetical protein
MAGQSFTSTAPAIPAVTGTNTGGGVGILGISDTSIGVSGQCGGSSPGVQGESDTGHGVHGQSRTNHAVHGESAAGRGVVGISQTFVGVTGQSTSSDGVFGTSATGIGVHGQCVGSSPGVQGESDTGHGVHGQSRTNHAVHGESAAGRGVVGISQTFVGVTGQSTSSDGVLGTSVTGIAVHGTGGNGIGVFGSSDSSTGVFGQGAQDAGVTGIHGNPQLQETTVGQSGIQAGVFGASDIGGGVVGYSRDTSSFGVVAFGGISASALNHPFAGSFYGSVFVNGNVQVTGDISFPGADFAEQFNVSGSEVIEPGCVVVIDQEDALKMSQQAYDTKVAGVVSGAGKYRPGIVLDRQNDLDRRLQVALGGKVYCKADAGYGAIQVGDLLTSSPTPGYAMKASDPTRAFGAVIGKALRSLAAGQDLIPILIALQ